MIKSIYLFSTSSHSDAISINSLDIKFLKPNIDFKKYDYLIITSKQTIKALQQYDKKNYVDIPALCVSTPSASAYEDIGAKCMDIGEGYGDSLISNIKSYSKESRWLYLRAKVVASDFVASSIEGGYNIDEVIVYDSSCSKEIDEVEVRNGSILIFTSPSSVKCFLKSHIIKKTYRVIVIGKTTAKALPKEIIYEISEYTTIQSCIDLTNY